MHSKILGSVKTMVQRVGFLYDYPGIAPIFNVGRIKDKDVR